MKKNTIKNTIKNKCFALIMLTLFICAGLPHEAYSKSGEGLFSNTTILPNQRMMQNQQRNNKTSIRYRYVKIFTDQLVTSQSVRGSLSSQTSIQLNLFPDQIFQFEIDKIKSAQVTPTTTWTGHIKDMPHSRVVLAVTDGIVAGKIRTENGALYQIGYADNGLHIIIEVDESKIPTECNAKAPPIVQQDIAPTLTANLRTDSGSIFDIMVLYTTAAKNAAGGQAAMESLINSSITNMNLTLANSQITPRVNLVHAAEVSYTRGETGASSGFDTALNDLTNTNDGYMDEIHALRDTYHADMVQLLFNNSSSGGLAWIMTNVSSTFESYAFSVVHYAYADGHAFEHEFGHNMGMAHDRANASVNGTYTYSYGYQSPTEAWRTVMAYDCPNQHCGRVDYWSNPDITYNGEAMGIPIGSTNEADARATINTNANVIANWRERGIATIPDLIIDSLSLSTTELTPGQSFSINTIVKNQGNNSASTTTLRYYQSTNSTITSSDTQLGNDAVPGLGINGTFSKSSSIAAPTAGTYWIGACVDGVSGETSLANNCSNGIAITVAAEQTESADIYEPDNSTSQASLISNGTVQNNHSIFPIGDSDWFTFTLNQNTSVDIIISGTTGDMEMFLYQENNILLSYDGGGSNLLPRIQTILPTGTYYIKINEYLQNVEIADYTLSFSTSSVTFSNTLYYPHVASGTTWETQICLINTGNDPISVILMAKDDNGLLVAETSEITLPAHARNQFTVGSTYANAGDIGQFTAIADADTLTGYLKFYIDGIYRVAIPAVSTINADTTYIPHIASNNYWWTGLSLVNTTDITKQLSLKFNDGQTKWVTLSPQAHRVFTIKSLFANQPQPQLQSAVIENSSGIIGLQLFGGGNQLSGNLLQSDTAQTLYFPHVASNSTWWTGIVAYNPLSYAMNLSIQPYSESGAPLSSSSMQLNSKEKYIGTAAQLNFPAGTAWFKVQTQSGITGLELFGTHDQNQLAGYSCVNIDASSGIFPRIEDNGWTGIAFVNLNSTPTTIALTAYTNAGEVVSTTNLSLNGWQKKVGLVPGFFTADISSAHYIQYNASQNIVGFQLNGTTDQMMLDALPGL